MFLKLFLLSCSLDVLRNFIHFIFSAMPHTLFSVYMCAVGRIYFIVNVLLFFFAVKRGTVEKREKVLLLILPQLLYWCRCLFCDKCLKCENRKLLINKRQKKSQLSLAAEKNTIERCPELLKCFLSFQETKVCRIQELRFSCCFFFVFI